MPAATTKYDLRSLKLLYSGGAPLGSALVNTIRSKLRSVGSECDIAQGLSPAKVYLITDSPANLISSGYGLTETSPSTHILPTQDCIRKVGSIGVLLPNLEARLVLDDGKDAEPGHPGELWLRGVTIMKVRC